MPGGAGTHRANKNRAMRQEALREQLSQGKHVEHVVEIAEKLNELDVDLDSLKIQRLKAAADLKLKLIDKYLPSLKAIEHTGEDGDKLEIIKIERVILDASDPKD